MTESGRDAPILTLLTIYEANNLRYSRLNLTQDELDIDISF